MHRVARGFIVRARTRTAALAAAVTMAAAATAVIGSARPAAADASSDNTVTSYGAAKFFGPQSAMKLASPLVGIAATTAGDGYWMVAKDGGIFSFGNAPFFGSMGGKHLNQPIVGMAATPSGKGYWMVASDGGIFAFGDAAFYGSTGNIHLNQPVVGMWPAPGGKGYWLVASDGGIFAYGTAPFYGSTGSIKLNQPVAGMAATPSGKGYWFVAKDGGIFAYGDAPFVGSAAGEALQSPVVGMAAPATGAGYWLAARDGTVEAFGVPDLTGKASGGPTTTSQSPVVGIAALQTGDGYWIARGESPVFSSASSGPQVMAIQQRLTDLGYWLGTVDGQYGDLTVQAVYAFQKLNGLPKTGKVDTATAQALGRAGRPAPKSTSGNLVEIDKTRQVIFFVRSGKTQWVFNTSTGTEKPYYYEGVKYMADTPPGHWSFSRAVDGYDKGPLGQLYRPRYFHPDGIAIHGYTEVPPYPASHGCARVTNAAIDFIWAQNLAPLGSAVWVYGTSPGT